MYTEVYDGNYPGIYSDWFYFNYWWCCVNNFLPQPHITCVGHDIQLLDNWEEKFESYKLINTRILNPFTLSTFYFVSCILPHSQDEEHTRLKVWQVSLPPQTTTCTYSRCVTNEILAYHKKIIEQLDTELLNKIFWPWDWSMNLVSWNVLKKGRIKYDLIWSKD